MITAALGKGLREPCPPYRTFNVFGEPPLPSQPLPWNCSPELVAETTSFDLSGMTPEHEVAVALVAIASPIGGDYKVKFQWFNDRTGIKLYEFLGVTAGPILQRVWWSSWIGWYDWEINENGTYRVDIDIEGAETFSASLYFDITGIPGGAPPEPTPESNIFWGLAALAWTVVTWLRTIGYDASANPIFSWLSSSIYRLSDIIAEVYQYLYIVSTWYEYINTAISGILSWRSLQELILGWLPGLPDVLAWFADLPGNLLTEVTEWWEAAKQDVLDLISTSQESIYYTLKDFTSKVELAAWWEAAQESVKGWIAEARTAVLNAVEAVVAPVRDLVNRHEAVIQLLTGADDVALRWLLERIENMIARLW